MHSNEDHYEGTMESPRMYLTGPMASGKSTVGKRLASMLTWQFMDLDDYIEKEAGKSIPQIFNQDGEAFFRELEQRALRQTAEHPRTVIATGGGALVQDGAMSWARSRGVVIYLQVDVEELARRVRSDAGSRPLLDRPSDQVSRMEAILEDRRPIYRQADLIIDANGTPEEVASRIIRTLQERSSRNV